MKFKYPGPALEAWIAANEEWHKNNPDKSTGNPETDPTWKALQELAIAACEEEKIVRPHRELERLQKLMKRCEKLQEAVQALKEDIEDEDLFSKYYQDYYQAGDMAMWFHDQGLPWDALSHLQYQIGQLEGEISQQEVSDAFEDIPF